MTNVFSEAEFKVLTRYKDGATVVNKDDTILNRYSAVGFVSFGFNWDTMEETARLTELGLEHM